MAAEGGEAGSPSGFATVAPWGVLAAEFVAVVVAGAGLEAAGNPSGFATVAPCGVVDAACAGAGDGVTVADTTFVVTFGAPAELVVGGADAAMVGVAFFVAAVVAGVSGTALVLAVTPAVVAADALATGAAFAGAAGVVALGADATTLAGVGLEAVTLGPAEAVVEITAVELDGEVVADGATFASGLLVGATVTVRGGAVVFGLTAGAAAVSVAAAELPCVMLATEEPGFVAAVWACGTVPEPGVPTPGNTVPCCRLPNFGCAEDGAAEAATGGCVLAGAFPGKLIGGSLGGTGMGAGADATVSAGGACGLRRNTPTSGADAAGTGPSRRARVSSTACTRRTTRFPSELRAYCRALSRSTTTRVTGGLALFRPTRTACTPSAFRGYRFCLASLRVPGSMSTSRSGLVAVSTEGCTAPVRITSIFTSEPSRLTCNCSTSATRAGVFWPAP